MRLQEFYKDDAVTKAIDEHIKQGVPFTECMFRPGSHAFTEFYRRVKQLYAEGKIEVDWQDAELLETDIGECIIVEGERVPLDVPIEIAEEDDADAVRELVLYADNDGALYQQSAVPIMKNLTRKWRKGVYDSELAAKLWLYHATRAAKNYAQEFGYAFSVQDRKAAAKEFEENWRAELEAGNAMESVQEGVEMCPEACCGKPVTECKCGPDCEHCDCYEKNKAMNEAQLNEKSCGEKGVKPNSPKRGGPKKFYVYVNTPSGNCKKISWGDTSGLSVKSGNRDRVRSFVARHKCKEKNDRTKAGYWACRTPRYKALGVKGGQWW